MLAPGHQHRRRQLRPVSIDGVPFLPLTASYTEDLAPKHPGTVLRQHHERRAGIHHSLYRMLRMPSVKQYPNRGEAAHACGRCGGNAGEVGRRLRYLNAQPPRSSNRRSGAWTADAARTGCSRRLGGRRRVVAGAFRAANKPVYAATILVSRLASTDVPSLLGSLARLSGWCAV